MNNLTKKLNNMIGKHYLYNARNLEVIHVQHDEADDKHIIKVVSPEGLPREYRLTPEQCYDFMENCIKTAPWKAVPVEKETKQARPEDTVFKMRPIGPVTFNAQSEEPKKADNKVDKHVEVQENDVQVIEQNTSHDQPDVQEIQQQQIVPTYAQLRDKVLHSGQVNVAEMFNTLDEAIDLVKSKDSKGIAKAHGINNIVNSQINLLKLQIQLVKELGK